MTDEVTQVYRDLMRLKPEGWTANAWAVRAGVSRTVWTDMRRHGNPSRRTLEKLLGAAGSSLAEFEALRIGEPSPAGDTGPGLADGSASPWRVGTVPGLPLVASGEGETREVDGTRIELTELRTGVIVDRLPRPPSLAADPKAYAFTMMTDAMWPRFRPGRNIAISPASPIEAGDDVMISLSSNSDGKISAFIAEIVERSDAGLVLRQFNPSVQFGIASGQFTSAHKVAGELI